MIIIYAFMYVDVGIIFNNDSTLFNSTLFNLENVSEIFRTVTLKGSLI